MATKALIKDLKLGKDMWSLTARVMRRWNVCQKANPNEVFCISLLLIDSQAQRIQATIPNKPEYESWKQDVVEGKIFEFEIFQVSMNTQNYRPTTHLYRLLFSDKTSYYPEEAAIPEYSFSFMPISDIIGISDIGTIKHLLDVIGFVKHMGSLEHPNRENGPKDMLKMILNDHEDNEIECVLFDECAFETSLNYMEDNQNSLVAVINLCRITNSFDGKNKIASSYHATRVFFNPSIPEVADLLQRMKERGTPISTQFSQTIPSQRSRESTKKDIHSFKIVPFSDIKKPENGKDFVIRCILDKFEAFHGWKYVACVKCKSKPKLSDISNPDSPLFCTQCNKIPENLETRLKLTYTIRDDDTTAMVTFWDNIAAQFVNKTLEEMMEELPQHKKAKGFPQGLEVHIGKTLLIRLRPNLYNEQKPGSSISVVDFSFCQDLIDDFNSVANMASKDTSRSINNDMPSQGSSTSGKEITSQKTVDLSSEDPPFSSPTPPQMQPSGKGKRRSTSTYARAGSSSNASVSLEIPKCDAKLLKVIKQEK